MLNVWNIECENSIIELLYTTRKIHGGKYK